jgi:alpha-amylase
MVMKLQHELELEGAVGDANLRTVMNWNDLQPKKKRNIKDILLHWQKLGTLKNHPAIGVAGVHSKLPMQPCF